MLSDEETNSFNIAMEGETMFDLGTLESLVFYCHLKQFPVLTRVAAGILSIPASSERVFSTAGRITEKRRNRLSSKSIDTLLFLHSEHVMYTYFLIPHSMTFCFTLMTTVFNNACIFSGFALCWS
jgi:hAT family C-terminal dimerisation region